MQNNNTKFLFFIERELHIPILINVMKYIHKNSLGEIGISSFEYKASENSFAGWGLRSETLKKYIDFPVTWVTNPYDYKPDITYIADFSYQYVEGLGKIVNLGHGTISKGWFFSESPISKRENCADLICVPGTIHKKILETQVFKPIEVTGMPKLDNLRYEENIQGKLASLGLDPNNKTLLFAPTFNLELSLLPHLGNKIRELIPTYINLIIKLHGASSEDWKEMYRNIAFENKNTYFAEDLDITPYFQLADILLTDVSSVIYEFISLNKPVILFDSPDQVRYPNHNENNLEYLFRNVGTRFSQIEKLPKIIFNSFMNPVLTEEQKKIAEQFISVKDGTSSEKVVLKSLELLKNKSQKGTIIFRNPSAINKIYDLYSSDYELIFISKDEIPSEKVVTQTDSILSDFFNAIELSTNEKIIFLNGDWVLSPMFPSFLMNHFVYDKNIGLLLPLVSKSDIWDPQNLTSHYRFEKNQTLKITALQLTYSSVGVETKINIPQNYTAFSILKSNLPKISELTDISNDELTWLEIIKVLKIKHLDIKIAHDTLIYKEEKIERKSYHQNNISPEKSKSQKKSLRRVINQTEAELRDKIEDDPNNPENIKNLIYYFWQNENWESMEVFCDMIFDDTEALWLKSIALEKEKSIEEALNLLENIPLNSVKNNLLICEILTQKGRLYIKSQSFDQAKSSFERALQIDSDFIEALIGIGTYYLIIGDNESAEKRFDFILSNNPENESALYGKALCLQSKNLIDESMEIFNKILLKNPENMNALFGLNAASFATGKFDKISLRIEEYLELHPANLNMLFNASGINYELGNYEKAEEYIERLLLFDEEFSGAKELKEKIIIKR